MKFIVLATLFACALAMPKRMVIPRLPEAVFKSGRYQMIPEDRIVGGTEVTPNSLPFQISLQRRGTSGTFSQWCGGSILDANVILNAAHCVDRINDLTILRVVAGEHDLEQVSGIEQIRGVLKSTMHEKYVARTFENDIALIFLDEPLDLSVIQVKPVNLPAANSELNNGDIVTASGWGTTQFGGSISYQLRSVDLPIVSDADCEKAYGNNGDILPTMLCAGDTSKGGIDACQGDSGGPLFTGTGASAVQQGIVSWGTGCGDALYPGVYTQVSSFIDWIAANRG